MATITLRSVKGSPLTNTEVDNNFSNINTEVGTKLNTSAYTAADVLSKLLTVDTDTAGINATTLKSMLPDSANTVSTIVMRDASGNFSAGTITASLTGNVTGNVSGNAGTVTNGVYTTGSYANPSWITSLASSKLTGQVAVANGGTGASDAATAKINLSVITSATGSIIIPTGTTAQRDASPAAGYFRWNTTLTTFEGYTGSAWATVGASIQIEQLLDALPTNDWGSVASAFTVSDDWSTITTSPTVFNDWGQFDYRAISTAGTLRIDPTYYTLVVYDGVNRGGNQHLAASKNNLDYGKMDADKQGILYRVATVNTVADQIFEPINFDTGVVFDPNLGNISTTNAWGMPLLVPSRTGFYKVTATLQTDSGCTVGLGTPAGIIDNTLYTHDAANVSFTYTAIAQATALGYFALMFKSTGPGVNCTAYGGYCRIQMEFIGS